MSDWEERAKSAEYNFRIEHDHVIELQKRIKQLEDAINKVFDFRISVSFAENINELAILQNELKKVMEDKDG